MKAFLKVVGWIFGGLGVIAVLGFGYVQLTWDRDFSSVALPAIHASTDSAVVARGEYLVRAVGHCSGCHTKLLGKTPDHTGPLSGGTEFNAGPFGLFYAANLTADSATGLGSASDGEIARTLRHGINRKGRAAPLMLTVIGPMADQDLTAIVSYLRRQPAVRNAVPPERWGLLAKALSGVIKPRSDTAPTFVAEGGVSPERGRYLALGPAACTTCHTPTDQLGRPNGPALSGSTIAQPDEDGIHEFFPPNLTPDSATGHIVRWSEEQFVARFKQGRIFPGSRMAWESFKLLTEDDVRSIYRFLQSLPPVRQNVGPSYRRVGEKPKEG